LEDRPPPDADASWLAFKLKLLLNLLEGEGGRGAGVGLGKCALSFSPFSGEAVSLLQKTAVFLSKQLNAVSTPCRSNKMSDPISITLLVSTAYSLATSVVGPVSDLVRASVIFPRKIELLRHEVGAMRGVVDECYRTIDEGPIEAPPHVRDLLVATFEQGMEVEELAVKASDAVSGAQSTSKTRIVFSRAKSMYFIIRSERALTSAVAIFRDKVGLLRDACSE
jgi:hypothetical protein